MLGLKLGVRGIVFGYRKTKAVVGKEYKSSWEIDWLSSLFYIYIGQIQPVQKGQVISQVL